MRHAAVLVLLVASLAAQAEDSGIGYASPQAALAALKADPGAKFAVKDGWTTVSTQENGNPVLWSFTPESHPAYPAVVKRTMFVKDGETYLDMKILCLGTKANCDKLAEDFKQLNERMKQYIHEHHGT